MTLFFFNDTATTEIYTLSLHDALPIYRLGEHHDLRHGRDRGAGEDRDQPRVAASDAGRDRPGPDVHPAARGHQDRKSTRLNSSHANISYAVFCLEKKKYTPCIRTHMSD